MPNEDIAPTNASSNSCHITANNKNQPANPFNGQEYHYCEEENEEVDQKLDWSDNNEHIANATKKTRSKNIIAEKKTKILETRNIFLTK